MKYWIIMLLTLSVSSAASAEGFVTSTVTADSPKGGIVTYTWDAVADIRMGGRLVDCYAKLNVLGEQGYVLREETIYFRRNINVRGIVHEVEYFAVSLAQSQLYKRVEFELDCY